MNKLVTAGDIVYFSDGPFRSYGSNLKIFMNFLKMTGELRPIKFSYTGPDTTLFNHLSVEENILLSLDNKMIDNRKAGFLKKYMSNCPNTALRQLFYDLEQSCHLTMLPSHISNYTARKILMVKSLLQAAHYMIFEYQHIDLDQQTLILFQKALYYEVTNSNKVAMLTDRHQDLWSGFTTKVIELSFDKKLSYKLIDQEQNLLPFTKKVAA